MVKLIEFSIMFCCRFSWSSRARSFYSVFFYFINIVEINIIMLINSINKMFLSSYEWWNYNTIHKSKMQWLKYNIYKLEGLDFNEQIPQYTVLPCYTLEYPTIPYRTLKYPKMKCFHVSNYNNTISVFNSDKGVLTLGLLTPIISFLNSSGEMLNMIS